MVFRWFGHENDSVSLANIKQIPGVEGIVWALHDLQAGEEWPLDQILEVKKQADLYDFNIDVVESVNVHDDIKLGLPTRDKYIERYKKTIENLSKAGVKVICYNFMPVFDWVRTDLYKEMADGSTALFYEQEKVDQMDPMKLVEKITSNPDFTMPGWEPERLQSLTQLFELYKGVTTDDLWDHLQYFLEQILPVAEENNIKMAIHPDDPPWEVFGLPRLITSKENIRKLLEVVDHPNNCITLCVGTLAANINNHIVDIVNEFSSRIPFAHIRNIKVYENSDFIETSHRMEDGSVDIYHIMKALHQHGFSGYVRPDHGRQIWEEEARAGYGLYDRALGIMYLWGIWDSLEKAGQ